MQLKLLLTIPITGLIALSYPVAAAAPGFGSQSALGNQSQSNPSIVLVQQGGAPAGATAKGGGGNKGGGPSAGRSSGGASQGRAVGQRSSGGNANRGGDGNRSAVRVGETRRAVQSNGGSERRVVRTDRGERRGDGDRGERRGQRFSWGSGYEFFFYDGYYHGDCSWLRRRYKETGSSYWLRRYRQCRED